MKTSWLALVFLSLMACGSGGFNNVSIPGLDSPGSGSGSGSGGGSTNEPGLILTSSFSNGIRGLEYSGAGNMVALIVGADLVGANPNELDQIYTVNLNSGAIVQITNDTDTESSGTKYSTKDMSDDGNFIAFVTNEDYTGSNPNNVSNIFLASTDGSSLTQVTSIDSTSGGVREVQISGDGSLIVFTSEGDLTGDNPDRQSHIFSINADGTDLRQVTTEDTFHRDIAFSDNGLSIAYVGDSDPVSENADGFAEVFLIGVDGSGISQLTSFPDFHNITQVVISDDGAMIAFTSQQELIAGGNADGSLEVFAVDNTGANLTQISNSTDSGHMTSGSLDISGDGSHVVFVSREDFTGDNPNGVDTIFWAATSSPVVTQLLRDGTVVSGGRNADSPKLTNDSLSVLFESDENYSSDATGGEDKVYSALRQ